ncbi:MAG: hypothetical protein ACI9YM_000631 [Brevundimonas sp.]|jgi:hypothetical protein|uniref:YcxB family protein n=1 Tax=Brevundimonas sp. TaxID=1871086 RepID=UPI0039E603AB
MIVIDKVAPTARELRPIQRGWGLIHWVGCLPVWLPMLAVLAFGVTVSVLARGALPPFLMTGFLVLTFAAWRLSGRLAQHVCMSEARKAPVGGLVWNWTIDEQGFVFDNGLQTNRLDWRGVKTVREEKDRFVFLVSPANNPVLPVRLLEAGQLEALRGLITQITASGRLGGGVDYVARPSDKIDP